MAHYEALAEPKRCDVCKSKNIEFAKNEVLYGRCFGKWPYCWHCKDCDASVGCHGGTNKPLGKMGTSATKELRKQAHKSFDVIWQLEYKSRKDAYNWLAEKLKIRNNECHMSWLTDDQLKQTIVLAEHFLATYSKVEERRKLKADAKVTKRNKRFAQQGRSRRHRNEIRLARSSKPDSGET